MKNIKTYILALGLLLTIMGCEETITIDSPETENKVVIEGLVTNVQGQSYVKVSRNRSFYDEGSTDRITNAQVAITTSGGEQVVLVHNPSGEAESEGFYYPNANFAGAIGSTYTLNVEVDGTTYSATDELLPVTQIDSLTVKVDPDEFEDPEEPGRFLAVFFFAKEPQDREDYYLFKFYRNDELVLDWPTDIYVFDDETLGESIDDIEIAGYYQEGERAKVEMYSLSREGFIFYSDLNNLINNDGGMFSPPPANPRNNLSNGALGFFQASAVASLEITVTPPDEE
ncbi:DUF4249 domain-containing protein [Roseivirga sp.]|uniref:DUF4249 domain-containing protein n=1 Tax=Roseivirga sp. TaxID=1964215 RepID=UPI003B5275E5